MEGYSIKRNILFLTISVIGSIAWSQPPQDVLAFADSSFQRGQYKVALKEYQRVLYFSEDKTNPYLFSAIGDCYFEVGDLDRALEYYDRAYFLYESDSLQLTALFNKIACNVIQGNFDLALINMLGLQQNLPAFFENRRHFYLGVIYFGKEEFETSRKHFVTINHANEAYVKKVNELFDPRGKLNRPNPRLAFFLSLFVPGTGQFYSGDIKNGLNSFVLNEGLLMLGIYTAYRYTIIDALISVGPWFQRYYQGGLESAEIIAEQKRAKHRQEIFQQTLALIEEMRGK